MTGKVRRSKTDVLPLRHATNLGSAAVVKLGVVSVQLRQYTVKITEFSLLEYFEAAGLTRNFQVSIS